MKLKRLKAAIDTFPPELDEFEVIIQSLDQNMKEKYNILCFIGHIKEYDCIVLGTEGAAEKILRKDEFD